VSVDVRFAACLAFPDFLHVSDGDETTIVAIVARGVDCRRRLTASSIGVDKR
jgi:hypothetical protein